MKENEKKLSEDKAETNIDTPNLDALLLDAEDDGENNNATEESVNFDAFMADFRNLMGQPASEKDEDTPEETQEKTEENKDPQEQFLNSAPKKKVEKKKAEKTASKSDWNEEITLVPEEYDELDDGKEMTEDIPEEPAPEFDLGEAVEEEDDKFQLSINFDSEQRPAATDETAKERKYDPDKPRAIDWVFDIAEMFVFVLAAVMILTSFVFKHSVVEGGSMLNTLEHGDHLIISNLFYTPDYDDIVVFEDYSKNSTFRKAVIKRIIALPGDTVEIKAAEDGKTLVVLVNGQEIKDEHAYYLPNKTPTPYGPITVGEGEVFVLGDNRYNSTDSREVGTINIDSILGEVILRFYPFEKFGTID